MSAETLREAARLMRERAEAATRTPWGTVTHDFGMANLTINGASTFLCPDCGTNAETDEQNAEHIASWHPAVALAVAAWLDDIAERHGPDPEPADLTLHYDEECPTGECVEPGYHEGCVVCQGCYPSYEGMDGRALYPCLETNAALAVARAYIGSAS